MNVETAQRRWEQEYKPSIQLLIDNGDTSYRPAMILIFCAIEHAYRAIHGIPEKKLRIEDAIRWAMPYYSTDELKERFTNWHDPNMKIKKDVDRIRQSMFNALKHHGMEEDGILIREGHLGFYSSLVVCDANSGEEESRTDTFYIQPLWRFCATRLDSEYRRVINDSVESATPKVSGI